MNYYKKSKHKKTDNTILKEQELLIKQLSNKTDDAIKQVKDIAVKALEGAANYKVISKDKKDEASY
ncbi:MAG: hypothetical protein KA792_03095 [Bacteroidales bacterium]|nr:hypothetical protein [Bacteroidales bacterium]